MANKRPFQTDKKPIEWLRETRRHTRDRPLSDTELMQYLIGERDYDFNIKKFEDAFNLQPLEIGTIHGSTFDRVFGFPERTGLTDRDIHPDEIAEKIVAPNEMIIGQRLEQERLELEKIEREKMKPSWSRLSQREKNKQERKISELERLDRIVRIISYLFKRIVYQRVPKYKQGEYAIDVLSEAILGINSLMELMNKSVWLETLWNEDLWQEDIPIWDRISILADGANIYPYEEYFAKLRSKINILENEHVREICKAKHDPFSRIDQNKKEIDIRGITDYQISNIFSERFVPVFPNLNLKYRIIINPHQKVVWSPGVCEKFELAKLDSEEHLESQQVQYDNITIHMEPIQSVGPNDRELPRITQGGCKQIPCRNETVSINTDRFDKDNISLNLWFPKTSKKKSVSSRHILFETKSYLTEKSTLSQRRIEVLSILWAHQGGRDDNNRFLGIMGLTKSSYNHALRYMFKNKLLGVMYHPNQNYIGLPDGVFISITGTSKAKKERVKAWLLNEAPYTRIFDDDKETGLFAIVRLPLFATSAWVGFLLQQKNEGVLKGIDEFNIQPITRLTPYRLTALSRIYTNRKSWLDPWK